MNKPAMSAKRQRAQSGFTLIELIVVIVILGILTATALPKLSSLSGDARTATLNAAKGALMSTSSTAHSSWMIDSSRATVLFEGTTVTFMTSSATGYPKADANLMIAAGVGLPDYTVLAAGAGDGVNAPTVAAGSIVAIPKGVVGTTKGLTCYVQYTEPTGVGAAPTITVVGTTC